MKGSFAFFRKIVFTQLAVASFFWQPDFWRDLKASISDSVNVTQEVTGICDRDGDCEKDAGENILNCEDDCQTSSFSKGGDRAIINNPLTIWGLKVVDITESSARIEWNTDYDGICELQWGRNLEYESVNSEVVAAKYHSVVLDGLLADRIYYFKVLCGSGSGVQATEEMQFKTLEGADTTAPDNVTGLGAEYIAKDNKILIHWVNPKNDFAGVIVLQNSKYFPRDEWDGNPICQGKSSQCVDAPVDEGKVYYYGVFTYDAAGNYSSGAGVLVTTGKEVVEPMPTESQPISEEKMLTGDDFKFYQDGDELKRDDKGNMLAKTNKRIEVRIDYEKFVDNCKSIYISIGRGSEMQNYNFRSSVDRVTYVADMVLRESDIYNYSIVITTFSGSVYTIDGKILLEAGTGEIERSFAQDVMDEAVPDILLLIAVALIIEWLLRKKKGKKKNKKNISKDGEENEQLYL